MSFVERQTTASTDRGPNSEGSFRAYRTRTGMASARVPSTSLLQSRVRNRSMFPFIVGSLLKYNSNKKHKYLIISEIECRAPILLSW